MVGLAGSGGGGVSGIIPFLEAPSWRHELRLVLVCVDEGGAAGGLFVRPTGVDGGVCRA